MGEGPGKPGDVALVEQTLRMVVENSLEGISVLDIATGHYTYLSPSQLSMTGFSEAEFRSMTWAEGLERVHPDDRHVPRALMAAIERGDSEGANIEYRWKVKSGEYRWISDSRKVVRDAGRRPVAIVGVSFDVTERRRADAELRAREAELRAVFNSPTIGVVIADDRGRFLDVNDHFCEMLGYGREEMLAKGLSGLTHPEEVEVDLAGIRRLIARELETWSREKRYVRKDGSVLWALTSVSATRHPDGALHRVVVIVKDVTAGRTAQAQLQVASRMAALGTLVAGVAHEINNPLSGCTSSLGLVAEDLRDLRGEILRGGTSDPQALARRIDDTLDVVGEASAAASRVARIVRDLSIFGRPDPERRRFRLADAVDESMRWLPASVAASATVRVEKAGAPEVLGSPGQVGQVVVNLVTNAARAFPAGRRGTVVIRVGPGSPGLAWLEVEDDGVGIPAEVQARIFDPFFTTRAAGQGMGLGLSVCHAIVSAHGGTITVASTPGRGSTFRVELPAAPVSSSSTGS